MASRACSSPPRARSTSSSAGRRSGSGAATSLTLARSAPRRSRGMVNALTIDVEEHFQAHAYERAIARDAWDRQPSRVTTTTRRILVLLAERGVRATFFVLGWVA